MFTLVSLPWINVDDLERHTATRSLLKNSAQNNLRAGASTAYLTVLFAHVAELADALL
jgi:hypothetical protein